MKCLIRYSLCLLLTISMIPAYAGDKGKGCNFIGSWIGYDELGAAWTLQVNGQSASSGTSSLHHLRFDPTLFGYFPDAVDLTHDAGAWIRTGGNTFASTGIVFAYDVNGIPQYQAKITARDTLMDNCDLLFVEDTMLRVYSPDADVYNDLPIMPLIPFDNHYGHRVVVEISE